MCLNPFNKEELRGIMVIVVLFILIMFILELVLSYISIYNKSFYIKNELIGYTFVMLIIFAIIVRLSTGPIKVYINFVLGDVENKLKSEKPNFDDIQYKIDTITNKLKTISVNTKSKKKHIDEVRVFVEVFIKEFALENSLTFKKEVLENIKIVKNNIILSLYKTAINARKRVKLLIKNNDILNFLIDISPEYADCRTMNDFRKKTPTIWNKFILFFRNNGSSIMNLIERLLPIKK
ncbi:MAG TPA: hypothetical protein VI790_06280 [Candidatus Nanoarchaeia archaeon]|nr:hypothetical protein [Candidatus Nanoarchaeia archaeon]